MAMVVVAVLLVPLTLFLLFCVSPSAIHPSLSVLICFATRFFSTATTHNDDDDDENAFCIPVVSAVAAVVLITYNTTRSVVIRKIIVMAENV